MKYLLLHNLGLIDAKACNEQFGAKLTLKPDSLAAGQEVDLNELAVTYLTKRLGHVGLLEPMGSVKGVAKETEVKAVKS